MGSILDLGDLFLDPESNYCSFSINFSFTIVIEVSNEGSKLEFDLNSSGFEIFFVSELDLVDSSIDFNLEIGFEFSNLSLSCDLKSIDDEGSVASDLNCVEFDGGLSVSFKFGDDTFDF